MSFNIPWLYIAVFVALSLFYYFTQKAKHKKIDKQERKKERMETLLKSIKASDSKTSTNELD
jgi:preprotein translocase subunit SecG